MVTLHLLQSRVGARQHTATATGSGQTRLCTVGTGTDGSLSQQAHPLVRMSAQSSCGTLMTRRASRSQAPLVGLARVGEVAFVASGTRVGPAAIRVTDTVAGERTRLVW